MAHTTKNPPCKWLAQYYDQLFGDFRGPLDAARLKILGRIMPRVKTACDLACGAGTTALALARQGIRMYGVDLSPRMWRAAREKARRARLPLVVIEAPMGRFRLPEPADLVIREGDALNHVPRKADLAAVAKSVSRALRPGGYFFFDVNNRGGFASYWNGAWWHEKLGVVMVMRNGNDAANDRAWSDVEWFIREGRLWRRRRERVEEVCWSRGEIEEALHAAGFDQVREWDAARFFKGGMPITRGCRSNYLARKAA
jgi:SAM-dependent methyltransferase